MAEASMMDIFGDEVSSLESLENESGRIRSIRRLSPWRMTVRSSQKTTAPTAGMLTTNSGIDAHQQGELGEVDLEEIRCYAATNGLHNLRFAQRLFQGTASAVLRRAKNIGLAHIDCNIYSSEIVKLHMAAGGYVVFDDARVSSCLGATEIVDSTRMRRDSLNAEQMFPQLVFRAGLNQGHRSFLERSLAQGYMC